MERTETGSTEREKLLDKIAKLRAMTKANGASESEAMMAAKRVAALIDEFNVNTSELQLREAVRLGGAIVRDRIIGFDSRWPIWGDCTVRLCKLLSVKTWYSIEREDLLGLGSYDSIMTIHLLGFAEDVETVKFIMGLIREAFIYELGLYKKARGKEPQSFQLGMADRIKERLTGLFQTVITSASGAHAGSLIVVKGQLVRVEFEKLALRLQSSQSNRTIKNAGAYAAGQAAGQRANLHGKPSVRALTKGA